MVPGYGNRCEAADRTSFRRLDGAGRHETLAVHGGGRGHQAQDPRRVQEREQDVLPGGDLVDGAGQDEGDGRSLSRPQGGRRRHHGAGLLQRLAASGHQRRRRHRRT